MRMPTMESRRREVRLREIGDRAARGLSDVHVPDLSKLERPTLEMPDIDLSRIDLTRSDVTKTVVSAATAAGLVRRRRRRWAYLLSVAIILGLTRWALSNSTAIRERLDRVARRARERLDEMRVNRKDLDPVAFPAAPTAPIEPGPYSVDVARNGVGETATDYPAGLGARD